MRLKELITEGNEIIKLEYIAKDLRRRASIYKQKIYKKSIIGLKNEKEKKEEKDLILIAKQQYEAAEFIDKAIEALKVMPEGL